MLSSTDTILRIALSRLDVNTTTLSRLLHVTASLYRKTNLGDGGGPPNSIALIIFEILGDFLSRPKARVLPSAKAMIEVWITIPIFKNLLLTDFPAGHHVE